MPQRDHQANTQASRQTRLWLATCLLAALALPAAAAPQRLSPPEEKAPAQSPAALLDDLYRRLAAATDREEALGIAGAIDRALLRSGSDTADLLMSRALTALSGEDRKLALELLDKVVAIEPDWAEGWNKRATVRFLEADDAGSMSDISHVLKLEPRHFGALSGMGFILQRNGLDKRALQAFRRTLEVYPALENVKKLVEKLEPEVEGRGL